MDSLGLRIGSLLFAVFIVLAAIGGWHVHSTLIGVETALPVKTLAQHREFSWLIQSLSRLSNAVEAAKAEATEGSLDELTLALDIADTTPRDFQGAPSPDTQSPLQALSIEIGNILSAFDNLLADTPPFDKKRAAMLNVRLNYALSLLESNYLVANKQALLILSRQVGHIERLRAVVLGVFALAVVSLAAIGMLLLSQRRTIAALRAARAAAAESEENYRVLAESSSDGITVVDESRYLYANPAYLELVGHSWGELKNSDPLVDIVPEHREWARERRLKCLRGQEVEQRFEEFPLLRKTVRFYIQKERRRAFSIEGKPRSSSAIATSPSAGGPRKRCEKPTRTWSAGWMSAPAT